MSISLKCCICNKDIKDTNNHFYGSLVNRNGNKVLSIRVCNNCIKDLTKQ